jgi:colanic acid biosynthesis glycosyl transferase WcaI
MSKTLLLIGGNFSPEPTGIGKYNGEMIDLLANQGFKCSVITSYPYYPHWKIQQPYSRRAYWFTREVRTTADNKNHPIEIFRCPQYVPATPTGKKRMLLDFTFGCSAFAVMFLLLFRKRYDVVITVAPAFHLGLLGVFYKKIRGGKFLYHIQDLQIEAARNLRMINSSFLIKIFLKVEKYILKNADTVSSISQGMIQKIRNKCNRDIVLFPNWVDVKSFYPLIDKEKLRAEFGFCTTNDKIVLYSGAIGKKQGLETVIHIAKSLEHLENLKFVICGSGPFKEELKEMSKDLKLKNIIFLPLQPLHNFNKFLNLADIHLIIQKVDSSDLVMPSKLTTVLAVGGVAIVTANINSDLHNIISSHDMGILVENDDESALTDAINTGINLNHEQIKRNARAYAEEFLSIDSIFSKYITHIASN